MATYSPGDNFDHWSITATVNTVDAKTLKPNGSTSTKVTCDSNPCDFDITFNPPAGSKVVGGAAVKIQAIAMDNVDIALAEGCVQGSVTTALSQPPPPSFQQRN